MTITYTGAIPSVNHIWKIGQRGMYMTAQGKEFKRTIATLAKLNGAVKHANGVYITIEQHHKGLGRVDLDNISKGVLDALSGVCYEDDRQVEMLHLTKHRHSTFDGCVICVGEGIE